MVIPGITCTHVKCCFKKAHGVSALPATSSSSVEVTLYSVALSNMTNLIWLLGYKKLTRPMRFQTANNSYIPQTEQHEPEGRMLFCLGNLTNLLDVTPSNQMSHPLSPPPIPLCVI